MFVFEVVILHAIRHEFSIQTFSFPSQPTLNVFSLLLLVSFDCVKGGDLNFYFAIQSLCTFCFLFLRTDDICTGYLFVFVILMWTEQIRVLVSSRPSMYLPSSCPEITKPLLSVSAWRIFEQKKEMYMCNEYLCICFVQLNKYICMSSLVFPCYFFWCFSWLLIQSITCLK